MFDILSIDIPVAIRQASPELNVLFKILGVRCLGEVCKQLPAVMEKAFLSLSHSHSQYFDTVATDAARCGVFYAWPQPDHLYQHSAEEKKAHLATRATE